MTALDSMVQPGKSARSFQPTPAVLAAALAHAAECQPAEACGVAADDTYFALVNRARDEGTFVMDMRGYLAVASQHRVQAIVHSHVYLPPVASEADRAMCEKTALPWLIVSWPLGHHAVIDPCGWRAPLVGRQWAWGTHDCFGLIRDGMLEYAGIEIPDFDRGDWLWWKNGDDIITTQFEIAGFRRLPPDQPLRHCDVLGMRVGSRVVNHLGLFVAPDVILHQVMNRLSVREVYGGVYQRATVLHLRHEQLMEAAYEKAA